MKCFLMDSWTQPNWKSRLPLLEGQRPKFGVVQIAQIRLWSVAPDVEPDPSRLAVGGATKIRGGGQHLTGALAQCYRQAQRIADGRGGHFVGPGGGARAGRRAAGVCAP